MHYCSILADHIGKYSLTLSVDMFYYTSQPNKSSFFCLFTLLIVISARSVIATLDIDQNFDGATDIIEKQVWHIFVFKHS